MKNTINYKGYTGSVEFSKVDGCFYGKVLGVRALISYEGTDEKMLFDDFCNAVDDYLAMCEKADRNPLWDELEKQQAILKSQENSVYRQLEMLAEAVMTGRITDWEEVKNVLFELIEFGDRCYPVWELYTKLKQYIAKPYAPYIQREDNWTRLIIQDSTDGEEEENSCE